jgi:CheY-specific phosphatase CheX
MASASLALYLIDSLCSSATEILTTTAAMTPTSIDRRVVSEAKLAAPTCGFLRFRGTQPGVFVVRAEASLARLLTARMLAVAEHEVEGDAAVRDAFGELVNMLAGNFKNAWVACGNQMELGMPQVEFTPLDVDGLGTPSGIDARIRVVTPDGGLDIGVHFFCCD